MMYSRFLVVCLTLLLMIFYHNSNAQGQLENGKTLKLSLIIPESDFGKFTNGLGKPDSAGVTQYQQLTSYWGIGGQIGNMFFLVSLNEDETMKLGLDVTWLGLSYREVSYDVNYPPDAITMHHITAFCEIGPSYSYAFSSTMAFDVSFKFTPTVGWMGTQAQAKSPAPFGGESWNKGTGLGIRYTPALYFRYNKLLIGAEFSLGTLNFDYKIPDGSYSRDLPQEYSSGSSPYSTLRVVIGKKF